MLQETKKRQGTTRGTHVVGRVPIEGKKGSGL
jgi:hypothetical protein